MLRILMTETEPFAQAVRNGKLFARYKVTLVKDAQAVIDELDSNDYDAIILGMFLPRGSGRALAMQLRDLSCEQPIILLSSLLDEENEQKAYEAGVSAYFFLPCSPALLERRTEAFFRCCGLIDPNELRNGRLSVRSDSFQAFWEDAPIALTAKELEILKLLMKNKGRIITREQLLERLWGPEFEGDPRVVDAHVKNLRHKLPEKLIVTHKGLGYSMRDNE